jgi:S-adenosylmethionine-diacylglycerol 3-amino-3-carboxypropyl transferase
MKTRIFDGLNYSFGNEDCAVETALLPLNTPEVVSVCHSGTQIIPFLSRKPASLTLVDVSNEQLVIAELRLFLLRALSFDDYLRFWGYPPYADEDLEGFRRSSLGHCDFKYRDQVMAWLQHAHWCSPLYIGKWESTVAKMSYLYRLILGARGLKHLYSDQAFPKLRWRMCVTTAKFLAAAYAIFCKSELPPGTKATQLFQEYERIFDAILASGRLKENFFFEMLLFGKILHVSANPLEAQRAQYEDAQSWVSTCNVRFVKSDVFDFIRDSTHTFDFVALSNVPSYLSGYRSEGYLQEMKHSLNIGARVVSRTFLNNAAPDLDGFSNDTASARAIIEKERTQIYSIALYCRN